MTIVICSNPGCQTTAGCKCTTVWRNPAPDAAAPLGNARVFTGYVMAPMPDKANRAASIICGHGYVQRMTEDEQTEFFAFVKEVLDDKYV